MCRKQQRWSAAADTVSRILVKSERIPVEPSLHSETLQEMIPIETRQRAFACLFGSPLLQELSTPSCRRGGDQDWWERDKERSTVVS